MFDMAEFTSRSLFDSARGYKKVSKGSDHWLASELLLPDTLLQPISHAIDIAVCTHAWGHQMFLNLHPELGKEAGGVRTIAKTPKLYRLWARTRRLPVATWEAKLVKPYDTAGKGSSALLAAADRSMFAEIAVRNKKKVCGSFFDLRKFFDTIQPVPLFEAFVDTSFPLIDALMGFQMHMAPRVILVNTIPSIPIRIDASILAGCIYSVPWVKSLFHPGSKMIMYDHPRYKTYVDDVSNIAAGYGPDVQDAIIRCALAFNKLVVVRKKFQLSSKSAVVASDRKLAVRVAQELASYGIVVQVGDATRDVGVMFAAGTSRNMTGSKKRMAKARRRTNRIIRVAAITRSARKLFTSGAFPQACWGHQCVGVSPPQVLALRRMAAASTGISMKSQRCLTSCIFVCYGKRGDPWQRILKEQVMLYVHLMPSFFADSQLELAMAWSDAKRSVCV
jgi:hypothetical protein